MFKNESEILKEWITHYLNEGCSRFFLIDNGSTDAYGITLNSFSDHVELIVDATRHAQAELYNKHFLEKTRAFDWTLICDLDEFVYARDKHTTIRGYLHSVDADVTQVVIPWKLFGSNGYNDGEIEPPSVIDNFTKRANYDKESGFQGVSQIDGDMKFNLVKSLQRTAAVERFDVHRSSMASGRAIQSNGEEMVDGPFAPMNETTLMASQLHLNHYAIRSWDWFSRIKVTRGDGISSSAENARSREYYDAFDSVSSDVHDFELCRKLSTVQEEGEDRPSCS